MQGTVTQTHAVPVEPPPSTPTFTIIVISKDDLVGLDRTLRSIESQDCRGHTTVLVTKGESDRIATGNYDLGRLVHVRQRTAGISNAFNEGLTVAEGEWVNFLNGGDVYAHPRVLTEISRLLESSTSIIAGRAMDVTTGTVIPRDRTFARRDHELVSHQATFFRRNLFRDYGGYCEKYSVRMDFEWMLRIARTTPVYWLDRELVRFQGAGVSSSRPWRSCVEELAALRRHGRGPVRIVKLLALNLPFRLARALLRRAGRSWRG